MLQKVAEILDETQILIQASEEPSSLMRLAHVAGFFCAQYYSAVNRTKKPFNPILGETFEFLTPEYKFFSEQVSHHPPISACHCESDLWEFFMHTHMRTSFWGKSLECKPLGSLNLRLKKWNEHYMITRPKSACCNMIFGKMYIDQFGESVALNKTTGEKLVMNFKKRGWSGKNYGACNGILYDKNGKERFTVSGSWIHSFSITNIATGKTKTIWTAKPRPPFWEDFYYFSHFTKQLNYLPRRLEKILPRTDCRFRPDQIALERGDLKKAASEKFRLEEKQRAARKEREKHKVIYKPLYFKESTDPETGEKFFRFNNQYWKDREEKNWVLLPDLFS